MHDPDTRTDRELQADHDQAEHDAVTADQQAERERELAHEATVDRLVAELRILGTEAGTTALLSVERLADEVVLRQPPNVHRYELLMRQQSTALLAAIAAANIEHDRPYNLVGVVEAITTTYLAQHSTGRDDQAGRAARMAAELVRAVAVAVAADGR